MSRIYEPLTINSWGETYIGKRRHNEDAFGLLEPPDPQVRASHGCLYVVSDGMGGHAAGDVASRLAVDTVLTEYYQADEKPEDSLARAIHAAHQRIYQTARQDIDLEGMGCTIVAGVVLENRVMIAHVGDSRCYRARDCRLELLTQDHLYVIENLGLTAVEAQTNPMRHALSRALGVASEVDLDLQFFPWQPEDRYLLCSDGLSNTLEEAELLLALKKDTAQEAVAYLLHQAYYADDNVTAIVIYLIGKCESCSDVS